MTPTTTTCRERADVRVIAGTSPVATARDLLTLVYLEHRTILALSALYIATGGILLRILHRPWPIALSNRFFLTTWMLASTLWLLRQWVQSPSCLRRALSPPRVGGAILVVLLAVPTQITFQGLKQSIGPAVGFHSDPLLHAASVRIHSRMAWQWLAPVLDHPHIVRLLDVTYTLWFPAMLVFALWCSWTSDRPLRQRAIMAFLLMWIVAGTVVAAAFSSAGPIYYGKVVSGPNPYAALVEKLDAMSASGVILFNRGSERTLWASYEYDTWNSFGGISAMPSLHVGIATLYVLIARRRSRLLTALLAAFAAAILAGSLVLGWHYPLDGYVGAALAALCWWGAGRLQAPSELAAAIQTQTVIRKSS
jgi:membrane-associated phospholipid phosphatase